MLANVARMSTKCPGFKRNCPSEWLLVVRQLGARGETSTIQRPHLLGGNLLMPAARAAGGVHQMPRTIARRCPPRLTVAFALWPKRRETPAAVDELFSPREASFLVSAKARGCPPELPEDIADTPHCVCPPSTIGRKVGETSLHSGRTDPGRCTSDACAAHAGVSIRSPWVLFIRWLPPRCLLCRPALGETGRHPRGAGLLFLGS